MSEPMVFIDQDLKRFASYDIASGIPLPREVALSDDPSVIPRKEFCLLWGIDSNPLVSSVLSSIAAESARQALSRASHPSRLYHLSGSSEPAVTDLREPRPSSVK
ncbi:MAG: hypothetical protein LBJ20_00865 [Candidatus Methanoplasma sp.]|jgi:hypothetical protein|nr:hypothetical protein [Candidatus Methanoplasma sp.]